MATRALVPNIPHDGSLGTVTKPWKSIYVDKFNDVDTATLVSTSTLDKRIADLDIPSLAKASDVNTKLENYQTITDTQDLFKAYYTKEQIDEKLSLYTNTEGINKLLSELVISDTIIFVDGLNGSDLYGDGTQDKPLASIQEAVNRSGVVNKSSKEIYATTIVVNSSCTYDSPTIRGKNIIIATDGGQLTLMGEFKVDFDSYVFIDSDVTVNSVSKDKSVYALTVARGSSLYLTRNLTVNSQANGITVMCDSTLYAENVTKVENIPYIGIQVSINSTAIFGSSLVILSNDTSLLIYNHSRVTVSSMTDITSSDSFGMLLLNGSTFIGNSSTKVSASYVGIHISNNSSVTLTKFNDENSEHIVTSLSHSAVRLESNSRFTTDNAITIEGYDTSDTSIYNAVIVAEYGSYAYLHECTSYNRSGGKDIISSTGSIVAFNVIKRGNSSNSDYLSAISGGRIFADKVTYPN